VADALGVERFHLVGHDWGGAVAWQVAGRHPDRLDTVTSVSTPHPAAFRHAIRDGDQRDRSGYIQFFRTPEAEPFFLDDDATGLRALYTASSMPEEAVEEYVRVLTQPGAMTGALNWYRAADLGLVEGLGPITTPTMYVWSTSDPALGPDAAEATADHVAGPYRFEVLEGVSHWIPEHAAETLNALLLAHLRGTLYPTRLLAPRLPQVRVHPRSCHTPFAEWAHEHPHCDPRRRGLRRPPSRPGSLAAGRRQHQPGLARRRARPRERRDRRHEVADRPAARRDDRRAA